MRFIHLENAPVFGVDMQIEALIKGLPDRSVASLIKTRAKVLPKLDGGGDVGALLALRDAIDAELMGRADLPMDGWSSGRQGEPRFFMRDGVKIAVVIRSETHGATKGAYHIEVLGKVLRDRPRNVDVARDLVEAALARRKIGQDT